MRRGRWFTLLELTAIFVLLVPVLLTAPGVHGNGDEDQYGVPEKREPRYPNLGSWLDQLVAQVEGEKPRLRTPPRMPRYTWMIRWQ